VITTDQISLAYNGEYDNETGILYFNMTDLVTGESNRIGFSMRWWSTWQKQTVTDDQKSGAYIFRPAHNNYDSQVYSDLFDIQTHVCEGKQQFVVWFHGDNEDDTWDYQVKGDVAIRISLIENLPVVQFEVEMFGIPENSHLQQEVTVNFHADIDNNGVFYTDSNALEMQRRQLNYRPTWNLTTKAGGLNITANFYPVNSAISMIDETTNMQMTVMNDRSQAGSVIKNGRIELMQNRRTNADDGRGVDENLNEKEQYTNGTQMLDKDNHTIGMSVPATYYVHLFNRLKSEPAQRRV
jgi:hypothetical protein